MNGPRISTPEARLAIGKVNDGGHAVFFHVKSKPSLALGPGKKKKVSYELSVQKCALGIGMVVILILAAFIAHATQWAQGASLFLDLTKFLVGGLAGAFVAERGSKRRGCTRVTGILDR
jgi:hypothetical protein